MPELLPGFVKKIVNTNYHFLLLIGFYVLHTWNDFEELLSTASILKVTLFFAVLALAYYAGTAFFFKNRQKAALFTSFSFCFFLFFSSAEKIFSLLPFFVSGLTIKLSVSLVLVLSFIFFKCTKKVFHKTTVFSNTLLLIFIALELFFLIKGIAGTKESNTVFFVQKTSYTSAKKLPSVYLILLDEYAGAETLGKHGFDNKEFLTGLESTGFMVIQNAKSNYAQTLPSAASLLNGDYIHAHGYSPTGNDKKYSTALKQIYHNTAVNTFKKLGYRIENFSPFDMYGANARYTNRFVPADAGLLLSRTIFDDIADLFPLFIARRTGSRKLVEKLVLKQAGYNAIVLNDVLLLSDRKDSIPAFFYIHLMMPHAPFAKDSAGKVNVDFFMKKKITQQDKNAAYLQYLKYTNSVITDFLKKLKLQTDNEAVILLMSDHGSRDLAIGLTGMEDYNSLNCIYFPGSNSLKWYNGMSNVNQFRILFSEITGEHIPLMKDSIVPQFFSGKLKDKDQQ
jgi:hypothetical protein